VGILLLLATVPVQPPASQPSVEMRGVRGTIQLEAPVEGFLQPLNHKLKLRASEIEFEPGGALGDHLHAGPGIRLVLAGELSVLSAARAEPQQMRPGQYFYEAGDVSFRVENHTSETARLLVVELLPADWQGSAAVAMDRRAELGQLGERLREALQRSN
jgi:quercetin dioxygenase-like cupin family protein